MESCENGVCSVSDAEKKRGQGLVIGQSLEVETEILLFGKADCPLCQKSKEIVGGLKEIKSTYFDLDSLEGLSKAAFLNAFDIPVTIFFRNGKEIRRWEKNPPPVDELRKVISGGEE